MSSGTGCFFPTIKNKSVQFHHLFICSKASFVRTFSEEIGLKTFAANVSHFCRENLL